MERFPFADEIVLKILGYLSLGDLIQCARVCKSLNTICKDHSLSYSSSMLAMKDLTAKDQKSIIDILIAEPEVTEVRMRISSRKDIRAEDHRLHEKAVLHVMIFRNKLYTSPLFRKIMLVGDFID